MSRTTLTMLYTHCLLHYIQHLYCCFDSRFCLVGIKTACTQKLVAIAPCYHGLHKSIGSTARGDRHCIVFEHWE